MTAEQLKKMQEEARNRHQGGLRNICIIVPVEEPKTYAEATEAPKTLSQLIDESYEFREGDLKPKKKYKKKEKIFLPDLMAAQIPIPCTSNKKQEVDMKDSGQISSFDKPHVPRPVQLKKKIFQSPGVLPDPPRQSWERPKAVYDNSKSPFGIYDELKEEWNKR